MIRASALAALALVAVTSPAAAQTAAPTQGAGAAPSTPASKPSATPGSYVVTYCEPGEPVSGELPINPKWLSLLTFPEEIDRAETISGVNYVKGAVGANALAMRPDKRSRLGARETTVVQIDGRPTVLNFRIDKSAPPLMLLGVTAEQIAERQARREAERQSALQAEAERVTAELSAEYETETRTREREEGRAALDRSFIVPKPGKVRSSDGPTQVGIVDAQWVGERLRLTGEANNGGNRPVKLTHITLRDADSRTHTLKVLTHDVIEVFPGKRTRFVAELPNAAAFRLDTIQIEVSENADAPVLAWSAVDQWSNDPVYIKTMTKEQYEDELREKAERKAELERMKAERLAREQRERDEQARQREAKRISVHALGLAGGVWIGEEDPRAAGLMGAGARVIKGLTPLLAIEAEFAAGRGEIPDVSETLGRALVGGRVRFGESAIWHMRIGYGVQVAQMSGPTSTETATGALSAVGAGVDWLLGDQLLAGVSAGATFRGQQASTVEAGVHVGYLLAP